jgi:hypothetical protein
VEVFDPASTRVNSRITVDRIYQSEYICLCFSGEELLGTTIVELAKNEDSTLGIIISGKQKNSFH